MGLILILPIWNQQWGWFTAYMKSIMGLIYCLNEINNGVDFNTTYMKSSIMGLIYCLHEMARKIIIFGTKLIDIVCGKTYTHWFIRKKENNRFRSPYFHKKGVHWLKSACFLAKKGYICEKSSWKSLFFKFEKWAWMPTFSVTAMIRIMMSSHGAH